MKKQFTIIELLVVVSIIGILAGIILVQITKEREPSDPSVHSIQHFDDGTEITYLLRSQREMPTGMEFETVKYGILPIRRIESRDGDGRSPYFVTVWRVAQ